jgi:hypothetical protein
MKGLNWNPKRPQGITAAQEEGCSFDSNDNEWNKARESREQEDLNLEQIQRI